MDLGSVRTGGGQDSHSHGIFVSVEEKNNRNGLKLPKRNRLNIGESFLTVRGAEIQEGSPGRVPGSL